MHRVLCFVLIVFAFIAKAADLFPQEKPIDAVKGQYLVLMDDSLASVDVRALSSRLGVEIVSMVRPNIVLVQGGGESDASMDSALGALRALKGVLFAEPNYYYRSFTTPNDPDLYKAWGLRNSGRLDNNGLKGIAGVDISAHEAWKTHTGSRDVVVAVIDSGIDYSHPDLIDNMWMNEAEASGKPGVDDDGNGYVDDVYGYNFSRGNGNPIDDNGHGTHCAGIIGAKGNNGLGSAGINWSVSLMAVKFLDKKGTGTLADAIRAIDYARKNKARIISSSWGGKERSVLLERVIDEARKDHILFVAAAGNDGVNNDTGEGAYPASYPLDNIIAVAAVDNRGELAAFSNYGAKSVHLAAPGVSVYSIWRGSWYSYFSGTSMAAPHVTGVAALLFAAFPSMTYSEVKQRMIETARPLSGLKGRVINGGMLNVFYALSNQQPPLDPNDPSLWPKRAGHSLSTEHPYPNNVSVEYSVSVPGAKRMSVHFSKFDMEYKRDTVRFFNGNNEFLGELSGTYTDRYGPVVDGDTVVLRVKTDRSHQSYGFDVDFVAVEF